MSIAYDLSLSGDPRYSVWLRLRRSNEHLQELNGQILKFFSEQPEHVTIHPDDTASSAPRLALSAPLPGTFAMLAGDALQNLRIALDHLAWALALRNKVKPDRRTAFPICGTEDEWLGRKDNKGNRLPRQGGEFTSRHCGKDAQKIMFDLQPYNRVPQFGPVDNQALWVFNQLARFDRHQTLTTAVAEIQRTTFGFQDIPRTGNVPLDPNFRGEDDLFVTPPIILPDDQRTITFSGSGWSGTEAPEHHQVAFRLAIDKEWPVAGGQSLQRTLRTCWNDALGTIQRFDGCFPGTRTVEEVFRIMQITWPG